MLFPASFPADPLTYVIRTISEFHSVYFAESKKPDCLAIYEGDFLEIDGHFALFLLEQFSEGVHALGVDPSTQAQHNNVSGHKSFYPQGHRQLQSLSVVDHARGRCFPRPLSSRIATCEPFVIH